MMRPPRGVIVRPQAGVDLRDDDLPFFRANVIHLFAEQRGGVNTMGPDFNFLPAVPAVTVSVPSVTASVTLMEPEPASTSEIDSPVFLSVSAVCSVAA